MLQKQLYEEYILKLKHITEIEKEIAKSEMVKRHKVLIKEISKIKLKMIGIGDGEHER